MSTAPTKVVLPLVKSKRAASGGCGSVRGSKRGRWRAAVLIAVHVLVAIHIAHWISTGRTITPVEPSESMQTLRDGLINAGFILFTLLILSTLVLGRFFCGWGCHVVALQDLSTWILRKMNIRPKPFRSRLLAWVPLLAALYMFALPPLNRALAKSPPPDWQLHVTTDSFWATFPGITVGVLTFAVCGFLIVYLLGNKGFCFYGCPYGGIFSIADRFAPGRIRVTDACEGCGHCTATCTSNVRVHEEVKLYGMVVDTGCMKCLDCIDVCPKDALYFGWGRPEMVKGQPRAERRQRAYDFTWLEEIGLALFFLFTFFALRGPFGNSSLYDAVPLLFSLGISSISAFLLVQILKMARERNWRLHRFQLRRDGRVCPAGFAYLALMLAWCGFLVHSSLVQYHDARATYASADWNQLARTAAGEPTPEARAAALLALEHLTASERLGLVPVAPKEAQIGALQVFLGNPGEGEARFRKALEIVPEFSVARQRLSDALWQRGERSAAFDELRRALRDYPELDGAPRDLLNMGAALNRLPEVHRSLEAALERRPENVGLRVALAHCLGSERRLDDAANQAQLIIKMHPDAPLGYFTLGAIRIDQQKPQEALGPLRKAIELNPDFSDARVLLARAAAATGDIQAALDQLAEARRRDPFNHDLVVEWLGALNAAGKLQELASTLEQSRPDSLPDRFCLACLYEQTGQIERAKAIFEDVRARLVAAHPK